MTAALGCLALIGCGGSEATRPQSDGGGADGATDSGNPAGAKRVFISATLYTGNLGGSASADAICTGASDAVGLGGRWTAWISTSTSDALSRIQDVGPWYLLDGTMVFANKANFRTMPLAPILISEHGGQPTTSSVWTGTLAGGIHSETDCEGFSTADGTLQGTIGDAMSVSTWTNTVSPGNCGLGRALYCIEQ